MTKHTVSMTTWEWLEVQRSLDDVPDPLSGYIQAARAAGEHSGQV